MKKLILAIETSCDETALALVEFSGSMNPSTGSGLTIRILRNLVSSQVKIHAPFGGVVPNLAKREHLKNLPILFKKLFRSKLLALRSVNFITVTVGPGLEPALWTGINFARELAKKHEKPLVGANHLEGHLYSFLLPHKASSRGKLPEIKDSTFRAPGFRKIFPAIALIVSGGHTILLRMESMKKWRCLGETRDDAAGEAFDKVARLLDLPYPGGPQIEKIARRGNPHAVAFPRPMLHDTSYDFSFSGLKTSVLYYLKNHPASDAQHPASAADVAASFQQAAVDVLVAKTIHAARHFAAQSVTLSGGVAANKLLRKTLERTTEKLGLNFYVSDSAYHTDNAAMIAVAGYMAHLRGKKYPLKANGNLSV